MVRTTRGKCLSGCSGSQTLYQWGGGCCWGGECYGSVRRQTHFFPHRDVQTEMKGKRIKSVKMGASGEGEISGHFKNTAAVILRLHSSPSMIQLSGHAAGFTAPRINGLSGSWQDSRGYAVRTERTQSRLCTAFAGRERHR